MILWISYHPMRGDDTHVIYFSIDRDLVRTIESNIKNTNPEYSSRWLGHYWNTWLNFRNYQCNITAIVIWCQHISFIEHAIREDCDKDHLSMHPVNERRRCVISHWRWAHTQNDPCCDAAVGFVWGDVPPLQRTKEFKGASVSKIQTVWYNVMI